MKLLNPNGILAIQIPMQREHPVHIIINALVKTQKWIDKIIPRQYNNLTTEEYFEKCENGYMEVFKLNQPTSHFRMNELIFRNCLKDQENLNDDDNEILYTNKNIFIEDFLKIFIEHSKIPTDELLTSTDKSLIEFNHITERTTYMHRKKVDLNKLNSKLSESIKNKKNKENKIELIQTKKD